MYFFFKHSILLSVIRKFGNSENACRNWRSHFVNSDFDRRKGFSLFIFPLPYSSFPPPSCPTRMTMAPNIIYVHNQCIIIIIIVVIARHRNWDQKCNYQILPLTLECWQNHKIPLLWFPHLCNKWNYSTILIRLHGLNIHLMARQFGYVNSKQEW